MVMDIFWETMIFLVLAVFVCLALLLLANTAFFLAHVACASLEKRRRFRQPSP